MEPRCLQYAAALAVLALSHATYQAIETDALGRGFATTAATEVLEETLLPEVHGTVPHWLRGDFLKQSASKYEWGKYDLTHPFDGYGKLLRWRFGPGVNNVTFRCKFLRSNFYNVSSSTGEICPARLVGSTSPKEPELPATTNNCSDNLNVNVYRYPGNKILALSDAMGAASIDVSDLSTTSFQWSDNWGDKTFDKITAAHPGSTDGGQTVVNLVMRINPLAVGGVGDHKIIVYKVVGGNERTVLHTIKVKRLPYVHSFTVTKNYIVIAAAPFTWELTKIMVAEPIFSSMEWAGKQPTKIYVMRLDGTGTIAQYETPAFFAFHHINGWEDEASDLIHFDVVANNMDSGKIPVSVYTVANLLNVTKRKSLSAPAELRRYTLRTPSAKDRTVNVTVFPVTDAMGHTTTNFELPTINPNFNASKYCFIYLWATHFGGSSEFGTMGLIKKNICDGGDDDYDGTRSSVSTWHVHNHFPSEAVFIPAPSATREDDGVVVSVVWDGDRETNYLVIINATTFDTVTTLYGGDSWKHVMSFGIHGRFFD